MTNLKIAVIIALLAIGYLVLFSSDLPREIEFQGHTLGPREAVDNNSTRNFDIYQYRDATNHRVLLVVMAKDETATRQQLLEFYAANFEAQGAVFEKSGHRFLGRKDDEVIYLTQARTIDSAVAFIEKAPASFPASVEGASATFVALEGLSF